MLSGHPGKWTQMLRTVARAFTCLVAQFVMAKSVLAAAGLDNMSISMERIRVSLLLSMFKEPSAQCARRRCSDSAQHMQGAAVSPASRTLSLSQSVPQQLTCHQQDGMHGTVLCDLLQYAADRSSLHI